MQLIAFCGIPLFSRKALTKTLLIMKCTAIIILAACLQVSAAGFSQTVTLTAKNTPLASIFDELEKQSGYSFIYSRVQLERTKNIDVDVKNMNLEEALKLIFKDQPLTYTVFKKYIVIREKENLPPAEEPGPLPPPITIKGRITDEEGSPLTGISITVKGTGQGTQTNVNGEYTLSDVDENAVLVFSSIGYLSQEVAVKNKTTINLKLKAGVKELSEQVVVVGYGTRKRQYLTGAVSTVGSEVLKSRPIENALTGLQGEVPGLMIQRSSGQPGANGFDIKIRGYSSTNGSSSPLVLIDGVAGSLDLINPDDIESVSVLKDAAASIYGARAAGGVMIVTTKRGKKGNPKISYSGNAAITKMSGMMKSPTNYEFAIMDNEANIHNGAAPMYTPDLLQRIKNNDPNPIPHPLYGGWMLFFTNTNWIDAVLENGFQQRHNINISGGGNNSSYYLSGGYVDQRGVIKYANDNNKRYNLRLNYDYDFSKKLRLESNVFFENQDRTDVGGLGTWILTEATFGMPNHPVYSKDGRFFAQGGWGNAVAEAKEGATATYNTRNLNTNFKLIADLLPGLKLNLQAGVNYTTQNDKDIAKPVPLYNWDGALAYYAIANPDQSSITMTNARNTYKNFTGYLQYNKTFDGKHDLDIMAGASREENNYDWFNASRMNFVTEDPWSINLGSTDNMSNNGGGNHWAIGSLFSRIGYVYDRKYMLEANLRYDGSSRFEPDHRWGFFPGISAGWRLSEEEFIKNLNLFSDLKLRASYGRTGNQEGIGLYDYLQLINIGGVYPFGAGGRTQSASLDTMVSLNRTWETLINRNIGIDFSMFKSKLSVSFDYFIKTNKNLLIPVTYPSMLGAVAPYSNSGELKTWGFEASVGYKDRIGDLQYSVKFILSDAQNKVVHYGGADTYTLGLNRIREGYPIDTYFAYAFDGIIRTQKELDDYKQLGGVPTSIGIGDARFKDLNGDGKISLYSDKPGQDGDVVNVGSITPRYNFGLNLGLRYKNFDFSVFLQGIAKRTLFREGEYSIPWSDWWRQPPAFYYGQTWNEDRPNAPYPRLSHGDIRYWNYQASTLQKINAAYIRLKNLQIGYSLPAQLIRKVSISQARIYFSGQDLAELHHIKGGWDPESSTNGFNYPFQRFYSFGLDITF